MKFVKTENLRIGMRLAKPIYNKKGVLLFERNSKLSSQAIESVRNFGLLGIYILEPAEPLPPLTEEDIEFERFQTMTILSIQEELENIRNSKQGKMPVLIGNIMKRFANLNEKINFYQDLRSKEDYLYRHSLNVAILCALMTHTLNIRPEEQLNTITAAVVHDIGKLSLNQDLICTNDLSDKEKAQIYSAQVASEEMIENAFESNGATVRRICSQAAKMQYSMGKNNGVKFLLEAHILFIANRYDEMTAMNLGGTPQSEVKAIQEFIEHPQIYDPSVVNALISSINILFSGVSVELNTGEKALVLTENRGNILRPVVLRFKDNTIIDLSLNKNRKFQIVDIMKTLDNRHVMEIAALQNTDPNEAELQ